MAVQLTHTGAQLDSAIRKCKSGYADVSQTTATQADVRLGKKYVNSHRNLVEGTMPDAVVVPEASLTSPLVIDTPNAYPLTFMPKARVTTAGYFGADVVSTGTTRYLNIQEKTVSQNGSVTPDAGYVLSKVIVRFTTYAGESEVIS